MAKQGVLISISLRAVRGNAKKKKKNHYKIYNISACSAKSERT